MRSSFMCMVLLRFRISTDGRDAGFHSPTTTSMDFEMPSVNRDAARSSRRSAAGLCRSRRACSNGTAGQAHKDTQTDCNCECDKGPMLELEHRPLVTLAVAVGLGILVGLTSRSVAAGAPRAAQPRRRPTR